MRRAPRRRVLTNLRRRAKKADWHSDRARTRNRGEGIGGEKSRLGVLGKIGGSGN